MGQYEQERGYKPAGGYAGLIPAHFNFGVLTRYYLWTDFRQPHRTQWRYEDFGPFTFDLDQYQAAVAEAVGHLQSAS